MTQTIVTRWALLLIVTVGLIWFASPHSAFAATGNLAGTVTYFDGTAISGATVTATNTGDGTTGTATTDSSGAFSVTGVAAGTYIVSVTYSTRSSDLDSTSVSGVTVTSGKTSTISSAILIGGSGWVACDSVITTNCVQSMTVNGASTSSARAEPFFPSSDVVYTPVYGVHPGTGSTYSGSTPYRNLSNFSFSTSDTFIIKILLDSFSPVATLALGGDLQSWSYDSATKVATYTIKPVAISRGATCDASSCQNQADGDIAAYLSFGSSDMSTSTAPAAWVSALNGGYISTNAQYVTYPVPGAGAEANKYGFSSGAPHLKADGTLNTGFFKVFFPTAMVDYMWGFDGTSSLSFKSDITDSDGSFSTASIAATVKAGGLLVEKSGISYSTNDIELSVQTFAPSVSKIGASIMVALLAFIILWVVSRKRLSRSIF
jgi:hypothetical protein